jgi:plastocyanin
VTWRYRVKNMGVVSILQTDLTVTDDQPGVVPVFDPAFDIGGDGVLSPGENWRYSATGTAEDLATAAVTTVPGCGDGRPAYENVGRADLVGGGFSQEASHYCNPAPPGITITKLTNSARAADPDDADVPRLSPGDTVRWRYRVKNTGTVPILLSELTVTDDQPGVVPVFDPALDIGADGVLSPGENWRYEATGTALNLATATGMTTVPGCGDGRPTYENTGRAELASGAFVEAISHYCNPTSPTPAPAAIRITKLTNGVRGVDPDDPAVPRLDPGDEVTWRYRVKNLGTVPILRSELTVTDDQPGVVPVFDPALDIGADGVLSPGENWRFEATGAAVDLATATGVTTVPGCGDGRPTYENTGRAELASGVFVEAISHYCNP